MSHSTVPEFAATPMRTAKATPVGRSSRIGLIVGGLLLLWCVLAGRLIHLQWVGREQLASLASRQQSYVETVPARPGEIIDRHGRLLATSVSTRSLFVIPSQIAKPEELAEKLAAPLGLDATSLANQITANRDKQFLWVKRRLSEAEAAQVRELKLPASQWGFRDEYLRRYPQGTLAAHILGLRDVDGQGHGGVEEALDESLQGEAGKRFLVRDARGRVIDVRDEITQPPRHGRTVMLTIDAVIQLYVERELEQAMARHRARGACAVVLDPHSGDVLALASRPTFDPQHPGAASDEMWKNLAVSAVFEPGSTFKPFIVGYAIDKGLLDPHEMIDCERGQYRMGRRILHDHHPYGSLSVNDVIVKSSNIGMAKIGERLGNEELFRATLAFGFGRPTGIELQGEAHGLLRPLKEWTGYSTGSIPMGQELAVTPLQLITAHGALANGGTLIAPRLLRQELEHWPPAEAGETLTVEQPRVVSRPVTADTARWLVTEPMAQVVTRGTGKKARLENYIVFGKTGTAEKLDPATGRYSETKFVSSFVGGAPADQPRVLCLVVVDEPDGNSHYGGDVAAPIAASILKRTLVQLRVPTTPLKDTASATQQAPR